MIVKRRDGRYKLFESECADGAFRAWRQGAMATLVEKDCRLKGKDEDLKALLAAVLA